MKKFMIVLMLIVIVSLPLAAHICTWGWHNDNCGPQRSGFCKSPCSQASSEYTTISACNMQFDDNVYCQCKQLLYHCNHPSGGSCNPGNIAIYQRQTWPGLDCSGSGSHYECANP